jgi:hypothetical protein
MSGDKKPLQTVFSVVAPWYFILNSPVGADEVSQDLETERVEGGEGFIHG